MRPEPSVLCLAGAFVAEAASTTGRVVSVDYDNRTCQVDADHGVVQASYGSYNVRVGQQVTVELYDNDPMHGRVVRVH